MFFKKPAPPLPKFQAPTATDVASKYDAKVPPKPGQTSSEYLRSLEDNKQSTEAVNFLAHGLPERESVWWACQSSRKVSAKLNPADHSALSAADAWVKHPTPETKAAAAAAAAKTDYTGPGGWAAQAAAWSQPPMPAAPAPPNVAVQPPTAPGVPEPPNFQAPNLTSSAVAGSVMLAAGLARPERPPMPEMPKPKLDPPKMTLPQPPAPTVTAPEIPPVDANKQAKMLQPFLDLGKDVASGKNTWG